MRFVLLIPQKTGLAGVLHELYYMNKNEAVDK